MSPLPALARYVAGAPGRLWASLITLPDGAGWRFAAVLGVLTLAAMAAVGFSTGFYHFGPPVLAGLSARVLSTVFVPGLGEEAPFRGLLIPARAESPRAPWRAIAFATLVFTLWHVVEATLILPRAGPIFLRPDFLACAALLGLGCGVIRWRTGSLWPGVALHWLVVTVWQTWLGGPGLEALR